MSRMETDSLLTGSMNGASGDYGSSSGTEDRGFPGSRRMSYSVAGQSCSVDRAPGEWSFSPLSVSGR
ncbi:hypothetical protein NQZ68_001058 [Dissostichus eleginoides]|nr:hypothetical protein NQZ68_001058 [Dissostichus eleginoides]